MKLIPFSEVEKFYNNPDYNIDSLPTIDPIATIDEMIEEYTNKRDTTDNYDLGKKCHLGIDTLEELKSRLLLPQKEYPGRLVTPSGVIN